LSGARPSQGAQVEALRPAWASWMPNFASLGATRLAAATPRAIAASLSSE
jgi:hypothetical protein